MNYWSYRVQQANHWLTANSRHGTHSPFVYRLVDELFYVEPHDQDRQIWGKHWTDLSILEQKKMFLLLRLLQDFPYAHAEIFSSKPNERLAILLSHYQQAEALGTCCYSNDAQLLLTSLSNRKESDFIIVDEPYRNSQQLASWRAAVAHQNVVVAIDLFHLGLLFFRKGQRKENFKIRFNIRA